MDLGRFTAKYWVNAFFASSLLLLGSPSVSAAFTLAKMPEQLESSKSIPLKKAKQLEKQRKLFIQAETALKRGRYTQYKKIKI